MDRIEQHERHKQCEQYGEQRRITTELGVTAHFDVQQELQRRMGFLIEQLLQHGRKSLVLGISGGIDSTTAGLLAQRAVERIREDGGEARFIAMRLPYGMQNDEEDAQQALQVIKPDVVLTADIRPASDAMLAALHASGLTFASPQQEDFILGNIKARQRMLAQYAVAGAHDGLVIGTDHAAEALMGFFTKHGDGACDIAPLTGLNKRRVRALASALGTPSALVFKVPTADLETMAPLRPDEAAFGVSYDIIDDFLEGRAIPEVDRDIILRQYAATAHKRRLPATPQPAAFSMS